MRTFTVVSVVVLAAAAWIVPLPWTVETPRDVVAVSDAVHVRFSRDLAVPQPPAVRGQYLASHRQAGSSALRIGGAMVAPGQVVRRDRPPTSEVVLQPGMVAALRGLGLSPVRMQGASLPVTVRIGGELDQASLGAALHIFDTTSQLDVARGRTVAAVGVVATDETLECLPGAAAAVDAATAAGADVVVVAEACEDVPAAASMIRAGTFVAAVEQLLDG